MLRGVPAVEKGLHLTLGHMDNPLKITILRSVFVHVREDQKIGLERNFHEPGPQMGDIIVNNQNYTFLSYTSMYTASPIVGLM